LAGAAADSNAVFGQILAALQRLPEADQSPTGPARVPERETAANQLDQPAKAGGRPVSAALSRTVLLLGSNPQLTAADIVRELGVTKSYARTLLRRAKEKAPPASRQEAPQVLPVVPAVPGAGPVNAALDDLQRRLAQAEQNLQDLSAGPTRNLNGFGRSGRSQVVHLAEKGQSSEEIAQSLGLPRGEVDFILKVERILLKSF
jgi:hypothetical protein